MGSSGNYGTERNGKRLRKELMVLLMNRYQNISLAMLHDELRNWPRYGISKAAGVILDALADLMTHEELQDIVGALEMAGTISHAEALYFIGAGQTQKASEEALASSSSYPLYPYISMKVKR